MRPHPLLYLLATRPQWLAEHALAYGGLAGDELALAACHWQRQAWLQAVAAGCAVATLGVAGVALLLWAVTPAALRPHPGSGGWHWACRRARACCAWRWPATASASAALRACGNNCKPI